MARPSKAERLNAVYVEARAEFQRTQDALRDERLQCLEDRRFVSIPGAMWEGQWQEQFENRPRLELNTAMAAVTRIVSEMRNNPVTVDFIPKDGSPADALADTCDMLFRADYEDSCGDEAVDNASEEAVAGGFGAFRLRNEREDEYDDENEYQRIRFDPIVDADTSVFFDLDAKRQDKSDAKRCWVLHSMSRESYIARWNDDPASWPKDLTQGLQFDWATPKVVYIAEYYVVEDERERMVRYETADGRTVDYELEDVEEAQAGEEGREYDAIRLTIAMGGVPVKEWVQRCRRVHKYIMSGAGILEDCGYIAGRHIPVVPLYGKRWFIDNVERCMGVVRPSKDVLRLTNMQLSRLAEIAALSPMRKPLLHPEQVAGHELLWANDSVENNPFLLINPMTDANGNSIPGGPVGFTEPPDVPPAMAAVLTLTDKYGKELLGADQRGEQLVSNTSAKAIELVQTRQDMNAFIYMSNRSKALRRAGEIWLSMAQDIYVEDGRRMKGMTLEGDAQSIELMRPVVDEKTGEVAYANDLSRAKMDVTVEVGPSFTSRRDAMVRTFTTLMQMTADPAKQAELLALAIMNMDGEGLADVREYHRKQLVQMGVLQPNEEERAAMAAAAEAAAGQNDPNVMLAEAMATEAMAKAQKAVADTALAEANAEKTRAQTIETLASVEGKQVDTAVKAAQAIGGALSAGAQPPGA